MNLECIDAADSHLVIKLCGEMDALGCNQLRPQLDEIANSDHHNAVIMDMQGVDFLDSSGIGAIVFLYKRLKAKNRSLELVNVKGQPLELIKLLRIDSAIPVKSAHELDSLTGNM